MFNLQTSKFIILKLAKVVSLIMGAVLLSFLLLELSPIDPIKSYIGYDNLTNISTEKLEQLKVYWGFDQSSITRFGIWLKNILHGDWGMSMTYHQPVLELIKERVGASLLLMFCSWVLSGGVGLILGIISGLFQGKWVDRWIKTYCLFLSSTPVFWMGILLLFVFSVYLGWLPAGMSAQLGKLSSEVSWKDTLKHLILPAVALSITGISNITMQTREKVIESRNSDYVLYALSRGESQSFIFFHHIFRNILMPFVTLQFMSFSELFGGSVLAETIFSYPGLGSAVSAAGLKGDVPLLLGIVIFSVVFVFGGNFIADCLYPIIDPRIRRRGNLDAE